MSIKALIRSVVVINVLVLALTITFIVYPNFYFGLSSLQKWIVVLASVLACASAIWARLKANGTGRVVLGLLGAANVLYVVLLWWANIL